MRKLPDSSLFYTVICNDEGTEEVRVNVLESRNDDRLSIVCPDYIRIDSQQLGELGLLFAFLADDFDYDSVTELIDGYGFSDEDIEKFKVRLKEMSVRM